jgi:tryptophanyl-tRNA synthetase
VGDLHKIFSDKETLEWVNTGCRTAGIGCIECKSRAADHLLKVLNPMQERRRPFEEKPKLVWDILEAGSNRAREVAEHTMEMARQAAHLSQEYEAPQVNSAEGTK